MKNPLHIGGILFVIILQSTLPLKAQPLRWGSSFTPAWGNGNTNGNANNVDGKGLNVVATVNISGGSFTSSNGQTTPSVQGSNIQVAGSASRIKFSPNFSSSTDYSNLVISFSKLTSHISFRIADIDKQNGNSNSYYDRVTITASDGTNTYTPTLTKYDATTDPNFLIINGNMAYANTTNGQGGKTNSNAGDQRGTINVDFGTTLLLTITIKIDNAPGVQSNPAPQEIAVGELSFIQPALPVKLIAFSAAQQENDVTLRWTTAQEINSEKFEIQRSRPGTNWETIGTVASIGNSDIKNHYAYTDRNVAATTLFYRLRQVDLDGRFEYSPIARVENKNNIAAFRCYPNPFLSSVNVTVYSSSEQTVQTAITDLSGKKILVAVRRLYRGNNSFTIPGLDKLSPGIYFANLVDEDGQSLGIYRLLKN